jgi:heme exporter protein CcmD
MRMSDFFAMGGYAWYVWMAYGVTALAIVWEIIAVRLSRRRALLQARRTSTPGPTTRAGYGQAGSA